MVQMPRGHLPGVRSSAKRRHGLSGPKEMFNNVMRSFWTFPLPFWQKSALMRRRQRSTPRFAHFQICARGRSKNEKWSYKHFEVVFSPLFNCTWRLKARAWGSGCGLGLGTRALVQAESALTFFIERCMRFPVFVIYAFVYLFSYNHVGYSYMFNVFCFCIYM